MKYRYLKQHEANNLLEIITNIEKRLILCSVFLSIIIVLSQVLLYYDIGSGFINPVYEMEGNLLYKQNKSIYSPLYIYGEIPESEDVRILKNGIEISRITMENPVTVYMFNGDIIEIDATRSSGIPLEIFFKYLNSPKSEEMYYDKMILTKKFYRLPPFYNN